MITVGAQRPGQLASFGEADPVSEAPHPDSHQVRLTEPEALTNLHTVLELCASGQAKCSATTGRPSAATIGVIGAHLASGDFYPDEPIAAFAWPLLLQSGGLAKLEGTRLQPTPQGRRALAAPAADAIRRLWHRWLTHGVIDEFSRIEHIKGQRSRNVLTAVKNRRPVIGSALATCRPGEWVAVDDLFAVMQRRRLNPSIARSERALWKLYLVDPEYGSLGYDGCHGWSIIEGRYTLAVLFEYAGTLGLIDLDYVSAAGARDDFRHNWGGDYLDTLSRYDGLRSIRLNDLGAYALGLTDTYQPPAPAHSGGAPLKVLANLDIVAAGDLPAADRLMLDAYARQSSDHVWTMSAASLLSAIDAGHDIARFAALLAERSEHNLPSTVSTLFADVVRRAGLLTAIGDVSVIECADPATAALIANDRNLRPLCRPLGDRHLAVRHDQDAKFRKALIRLGYVAPRQKY